MLKASSLLSVLLLSLYLLSCKEEPYGIGYDILPTTDTLGVYQTDTVTVIAYTVIEDSIRTDEASYGLFGAIMDPVFGKTSVNVYTQFRLSSEGVDFGQNPVLDSLVLVLYYDGYYGDTSALQRVKVWELSEDLYTDSTYYSNHTAGTYSILLADEYYKVRPTDSVLILGDYVAPHLRVNLSNRTNYLGNKILSAPANVLETNEEFIKFMKGLYIQSLPVDHGGTLFKYKTSELNSKIAVYYHNTDQGDSLRFDIHINSNCARFVNFNHYGYSDASPAFRQQVLNGDTALGREALYIQAMAGTRLKVHMPYLRSLVKNGKIAVNNAQLVFENADKDTLLGVPDALNLYLLDSVGDVGYTPDHNEGASYFGGTYNDEFETYTFRLTRHIQNILTGDTTRNDYLYISAVNPLKSILYYDRVVLNGTDPFDPSNYPGRLKLKLLYTKFR